MNILFLSYQVEPIVPNFSLRRGECMDVWMDVQTEFLPILNGGGGGVGTYLQSFSYRGCCPIHYKNLRPNAFSLVLWDTQYTIFPSYPGIHEYSNMLIPEATG